jgi:hypothetical protein
MEGGVIELGTSPIGVIAGMTALEFGVKYPTPFEIPWT